MRSDANTYITRRAVFYSKCLEQRSERRTQERTDGRNDGRINQRTDGRTDGRTYGVLTAGRTDVRTDDRTDGLINLRTNGRTDGRIYWRTDVRTDSRMDWRTDGWTDELVEWRTDERRTGGWTNGRTLLTWTHAHITTTDISFTTHWPQKIAWNSRPTNNHRLVAISCVHYLTHQ